MSVIDTTLIATASLAAAFTGVAGTHPQPSHIFPSHINIAGKYGAQGSVFPRSSRSAQPENLDALLSGHDQVEYDFSTLSVWKGAHNPGELSVGAWTNKKYVPSLFVHCEGNGVVRLTAIADSGEEQIRDIKCNGTTDVGPHIWDLVANKGMIDVRPWITVAHISGTTNNFKVTVQK